MKTPPKASTASSGKRIVVKKETVRDLAVRPVRTGAVKAGVNPVSKYGGGITA